VGNGDARRAGVSEAKHHELAARRSVRGRRCGAAGIARLRLAARRSPQRRERWERAMQRLARVARTGSLIFLLSDFRPVDPIRIGILRSLRGHAICRSCISSIQWRMNFHRPAAIESRARPFVRDRSHGCYSRRRSHERFEARRVALKALARMPGIRSIDCTTRRRPAQRLGTNSSTEIKPNDVSSLPLRGHPSTGADRTGGARGRVGLARRVLLAASRCTALRYTRDGIGCRHSRACARGEAIGARS